MRRLPLKIAIIESGKSQRAVAAASGIPENRFSEITLGWADPRESEQHAIAAVLGRTVGELFGVAPAARADSGETSRPA